jgi:hypothetical protein
MDKLDLNDFITEIFQDLKEIESIMKVLKDSVYNNNNESTMTDIENTLEIIIAKISNTTISLDKYINMTFE